MATRAFLAALLVVLANAAPPAQSGGTDVHISDGTVRYLLGRWMDGRLTVAAPCIPVSPATARGPWPKGIEMTLSPGAGLEIVRPRAVRIGSAEWNQAAPAVLGLAARREREQRLSPAASARGTRFLDWLFAGAVGDRLTYYFETSRRVPSPPLDADAADADPPSTLRVDVSGFARIEAGNAVPLGTKAELRWEEDGRPRGPQQPDLRPVGILRATEPVWILEDVTATSVVITAVTVGARRTHQTGTTRIGRCQN